MRRRSTTRTCRDSPKKNVIPPSFADLKKPITDYLADQQREQKTDAFLKDLKARAKIEIF